MTEYFDSGSCCSSDAEAPSVLLVHVVEDHDEALPHIYRAIARKKLPFTGNVLLHFDSHPDLLCPEIKVDELTDKDLLYSKTSIADWILPAVYMGHVGHVVWVKPPWAHQIKEGTYTLVVGKDRNSGQIRLATPLPYFINELLCVSRVDLHNVTTIPLDVVTLHPLLPSSPHALPSAPHPLPSSPHPLPMPPQSLDFDHLISQGLPDIQPSAARETGSSSPTDLTPGTRSHNHHHPHYEQHGSFLPPTKKVKLSSDATEIVLSALENNGGVIPWILDIDLDFFSTGNPFRSIYSKDQYSLLQRLYDLEEPENGSEEAILVCTSKRQRQLSCLKQLWCSYDTSSGTSCTTLTSSTSDNASLLSEFNLSAGDMSLIEEMMGLLWSVRGDSFIDPDYLHMSGIVSDLPVHVSAEEEIKGLVVAVSQLLQLITKKPSLITISRSTEDEYTPAHQVENIQEQVLDMLQSTLNTHMATLRHYINT